MATPARRYRAFYPEIGVITSSYSQVDSRQAYGHMPTPGNFTTTITRPDLFETYLTEQLRLIMRNHGVPVTVSESSTPIPLHFAFLEGTHVDGAAAERIQRPIRDLFDVPDLDGTDDHIANGTFEADARRTAAAGAVHRPAHRLFAAPPVALHGDHAAAFPELRAVHQLPVLHRRVRACWRAS